MDDITNQLADVIEDVWTVFTDTDGQNSIRAKTPKEIAISIIAAVNNGTIDPIVPEGLKAVFDQNNAYYAELASLRSRVEEQSLALIEARNPGIDMDEVRRLRKTQR